MTTPPSPSTTGSQAPRVSTRALVVVGALVSVVVAGVLSFFASGRPDGLEYVAESLGFADTARDSATSGSPLADYATTGVSGGFASGGLAGLVGVAVTAAVMVGLVLVLRRLGRRRG